MGAGKDWRLVVMGELLAPQCGVCMPLRTPIGARYIADNEARSR
jgi:hypothetical protein